jgi:glycosyltransferase involved in cell wall biosynthesis
VTKGRKGYLAEALNSYEKFIETGDVNVILIDNGSDKYSKEILDQWRFKYNSKVQYFRSETNEQLSGVYFWEKIKAFNPEWILFPGDDDVLVFDIFVIVLLQIYLYPMY